jgi:hypothetical protein
MIRLFLQYIALPTLIGTLLIVQTVANAAADNKDLPRGHTKFTAVVTEKTGSLTLTTPKGVTHQLDANMARRHGQEPFKAGEEVIVVPNENNYIVDMHRKGREGIHQLVTGKLVHVGMTKKEIKPNPLMAKRSFR